MDLYLYSVFPVYWLLKAALQHLSDSPINTLMAEAAMQSASSSSGNRGISILLKDTAACS